MSKLNGHGLNGHGNGDDDRPNVASLDEARRRAAEKAKAQKRAQSSGVVRSGPRSARDWVIGGLIVVMAVGYIASFFIGTAPVTTGGAQ